MTEPNNVHLQTPPLSKKHPTFISFLIATLGVIGLVGCAIYTVIELDRVEQIVQQQKLQLNEYGEKNNALTRLNEDLERELSISQDTLKTAQERVAVLTQQLNDQQAKAAELAALEPDNGPCAVIQGNITRVEKELRRVDFFRLHGQRQNEAEVLLDDYKESLKECLLQLNEPTNLQGLDQASLQNTETVSPAVQ